MEPLLLVIAVILTILMFLTFKIVSRLSSINDAINNALPVINDIHYYLIETHKENIQEFSNSIEEFSLNTADIKSDIHEIKYVMDIIYKYKLPNKEERKLLDTIAIDKEHG